ncbi:T9SS type A sorting domain-containing protein [Ignavibacteria bacterium CHB1]|nr:T9SS type A sorting domain-containing protein [Ignavibacteria bacterium]MCC6886152.1 T9SS type A sorting domain-containing protein [Ignavibacteriales bacterium]MDL1886708.1 T9SS type A sorting domain-containing protein [Ignavibacteria bacterium CHB1]
MKHFILYLLMFFVTLPTFVFGIYSTPGNNSSFTLQDLVAVSSGAVTFSSGEFQMNDTIIISNSDTLKIITDETVRFATSTYLGISGTLIIDPPMQVLFSAIDTTARYLGVRVDESNSSVVRNLIFEYANSFRIFNCNMLIDSCTFRYNTSNTSFGNAAISLFNAKPVITNSEFIYNRRAAIQGGANIANAPIISGNTFMYNNTGNSNVPQINLGSTGNDTTFIINNQILRASTNSGGIAFLPIGNANIVISGNTIKNNRYGLTLQGGSNINARIFSNIIDSNNTQNNPNLGGSGLNFIGSSPQNTVVTGNVIRWNLWGITIQNQAKPNIGNIVNSDTSDNGKNYFFANGNSGQLFDLYNNTPDSIYAQNNNWGVDNPDSVEARIFHKPDDPSLGFVNYLPIMVTGISNENLNYTDGFKLLQNYPNPFNPETTIKFSIPEYTAVTLEVFDVTGKLLYTLISTELQAGSYSMKFNANSLASGIYFYKLTAGNYQATRRFILLK